MFPDNLTRAEARARSSLIETHTYAVEVDLTGGDGTDVTTFISRSAVSFVAREAGRLHIDLIAEQVRRATLNGVDLDPATFDGSRLPFEVEAGPHVVTVEAICRYSRSGEGLHRFVDPADGRVYLYTQFEVADARRMYACFEQPDLKATFSIAVLAPAHWTVVSGGQETARSEVTEGIARWQFSETARISTYLTALVAGDYHAVEQPCVTAAGEIPMAILVRQSLAQHLDAERIFATTKAGLAVFEQHFGVAYPFGKYDQAFVPEYNSGAMENAGCVVLRDEYVFRSKVTAATYQSRDDTILHELSHMWFGDLVTMAWWDDLWLKESFATWASHFASSETAADPSLSWAGFCNSFKGWAYRQDQLPSTHPIAADMVDLEAVELNFDGITYAKGASVLVQLVAFVGRREFLAGVRTYFAENAYGNTELADLLRALHQTSGRDLSGWSAEWLETAGVNTLRPQFEVDASDRFTSFVVEQSAPEQWPTLRSHRIAIGLYAYSHNTLVRTARIETDICGASTSVDELIGLRQPDLILLNDDDLTYAKVRLDPASLRFLIQHINELPSALTRAVCWTAAWDMCRDAELSPADFADLAIRGVGAESDLTAVRAVLGQGAKAVAEFTAVDQREAVARRWQDGLSQLLADAEPGSDHQLSLAKGYPAAVIDDAAVTRLAGWLDGRGLPASLDLDHELRWTVVTHLARLGRLDEAAIEEELARDRTITGAEQAAGARAARPSAAAKAAAWRLAVEEDQIPNTTQRQICLTFWQRGQDEILLPYIDRYFAAAEDISASRGVWATKGVALRGNVLRSLFPQPEQLAPFLERLDAWLARTELADSVLRTINERRDDTLRALHCQRTRESTTR